jgi:hypothetical protein
LRKHILSGRKYSIQQYGAEAYNYATSNRDPTKLQTEKRKADNIDHMPILHTNRKLMDTS